MKSFVEEEKLKYMTKIRTSIADRCNENGKINHNNIFFIQNYTIFYKIII